MSFERNLHQDATEGERRASNTVIMARVEEIDTKNARIRISAADIASAWIPFSTNRAGPDRTWHAPEPGEQIVLAVPCGDLNQACYVGSIYQEEYPAAEDSIDVSSTVWKDGAFQRYDREKHHWHLSVPAGGMILLEVGEGTSIKMTSEGIWARGPVIHLN